MEKTTTIRLEINGEPAKNKLEALRQRVEILSQKISAIKFPNSQDVILPPLGTSVTPPIATQQRESENLTEQQLRDLKRLEQKQQKEIAKERRNAAEKTFVFWCITIFSDRHTLMCR